MGLGLAQSYYNAPCGAPPVPMDGLSNSYAQAVQFQKSASPDLHQFPEYLQTVREKKRGSLRDSIPDLY